MKAKLRLVNDQKAANGNGNGQVKNGNANGLGKKPAPQNGFKSGAGKKPEPQNGFGNGADDKKKIEESVSALAKQDIGGLIDSATYSTIPEVRWKALEMLKGVPHALRFLSANSPYSDTAEEAERLLRPVSEAPEKP